MNVNISQKMRDIIQKYMAGAFKKSVLEFYGIKSSEVKETVNTELPEIEIKNNIMDFVFLLEDDTYLHLEFQTVYEEYDLIRFCLYDYRLYARDKRKINTVIIYLSNSEKIENYIDIGVSRYEPQIIKMFDYDGNSVYNKLEDKLKNNIPFDDLDIVNLSFIPLMKNSQPKSEVALKSIKLAKNIKDKQKQNVCIASLFALSSVYLNKAEISKLVEVLKMVDVYEILAEELEKDFNKKMKEREKEAKKETKKEIAKKFLLKNYPISDIIEITGLDEKTILDLKAK